MNEWNEFLHYNLKFHWKKGFYNPNDGYLLDQDISAAL